MANDTCYITGPFIGSRGGDESSCPGKLMIGLESRIVAETTHLSEMTSEAIGDT